MSDQETTTESPFLDDADIRGADDLKRRESSTDDSIKEAAVQAEDSETEDSDLPAGKQ